MDPATMNILLAAAGAIVGWLIKHFMGKSLPISVTPTPSPANGSPSPSPPPTPSDPTDPLASLPGLPGHPILRLIFPLLGRLAGGGTFGATAPTVADTAMDSSAIEGLAGLIKSDPSVLEKMRASLGIPPAPTIASPIRS